MNPTPNPRRRVQVDELTVGPNGQLSGVSAQVLDQGNGIYYANVRIVRMGTFQVQVLLDGKPVRHGRLSLHVVPGECEPSKCKSAGTGIRKAEAGYSSTFWVSVHDRYGNQLPESKPDIRCTLEGSEKVKRGQRIRVRVDRYPRSVTRTAVSPSLAPP